MNDSVDEDVKNLFTLISSRRQMTASDRAGCGGRDVAIATVSNGYHS